MNEFGIGVPDELARLSLGKGSEPPTMPRVDMRRQGVVALDITEKFSRAVDTLEPGEIVKDDFFTLFDAVAALEIMDPKMDSGCVDEGAEVEAIYDVSKPLLPEEVLGIMDQLLCHEMSWHLGYPLSQTLLTSVYVEALSMPDPKNIKEATFVRNRGGTGNFEDPMLQILRAYCLGLLKSCGYVNERIKAEHFYEEEDFVTNTYHRTLLANLPTAAIREALLEATHLIQAFSGSISPDLLQGLATRLELRQLILDAVECPQHVKTPHLAREAWRKALKVLPDIERTHSLGRPVLDAFSVKLQRKLASTMPPRPIIELQFDDAFGHLKNLFQDGLDVIGVLEYTDSQCLMTFVSLFQAKKPQPLIYIRTLLQTFLFDAMEILGSMSIRQVLDDDFSIITLPASPLLDRRNDGVEAIQDPRYVMASQMELFRTRAAQPFLDILRTACQNRCRVRRTLCHLIQDWESLQIDAEEIEHIIQTKTRERPIMYSSSMSGTVVESFSLPLSSWTYWHKLRQMEWIVQLGFELEVYQPDELAGMYWYLNSLSRSRLQHTERIQSFILHRAQKLHTQSQALDPAVDKQVQRSLDFIRTSLVDAAVTWELSDALSCLYAALLRLKLIKTPPRPYSTDELRYEVRMRPFAPIGHPPLPTFKEFTNGTLQSGMEVEDLLRYGEKTLAGARRGFELLSRRTPEESFSVGSHERWTSWVKNGLKSCIATGISISTVLTALEMSIVTKHLDIKVEVPPPGEGYHEYWIVPRIITTKRPKPPQ